MADELQDDYMSACADMAFDIQKLAEKLGPLVYQEASHDAEGAAHG